MYNVYICTVRPGIKCSLFFHSLFWEVLGSSWKFLELPKDVGPPTAFSLFDDALVKGEDVHHLPARPAGQASQAGRLVS